jgi:hypothetical protein
MLRVFVVGDLVAAVMFGGPRSSTFSSLSMTVVARSSSTRVSLNRVHETVR